MKSPTNPVKPDPVSSLILLTHLYSGVTELLLVIASFTQLAFLQVHFQLVVALIFTSTLIYSLLLEKDLKWFFFFSWAVLCSDVGFLLVQCIQVSIYPNWSTSRIRVLFSAVLILAVTASKLYLHVRLMTQQWELLKMPFTKRLGDISRATSEKMQLFIWMSILYSLLLCTDILLSKVLIYLEQPLLVTETFLLFQITMPVILSNLIFKLKDTVEVSLVLFVLCTVADAVIIYWVVGVQGSAGSVQGILRICLAGGRTVILFAEWSLLWSSKKALFPFLNRAKSKSKK